MLALTNWLPDNVVFLKLRGLICRPFFGRAGKLLIGRNVTFYNPSKIFIGDNVYFALGTWLCADAPIEIGSNVLFGPYVVVVTSNHSILNGSYMFGGHSKLQKVVIDDGSWIAAHVTILSGCSVGGCSLIAANSVLNMNTETNSIYGGVPAKRLK